MFSKYLESKHDLCKELLSRLVDKYPYVSILGKHVTGDSVRVSTFNTTVGDTMEKQCGFVVKIYNGKSYSEYSFSDITRESIDKIERDILEKTKLSEELLNNHVDGKVIPDVPLKQDFFREREGGTYSIEEVVNKLTGYKNLVHSKNDKVLQTFCIYENYEVSSFFISKNRDLRQNYPWTMAVVVVVVRDGNKVQNARQVSVGVNSDKIFADLESKLDSTINLAIELLDATMIEPGEYEIITNPSITGLIAHEAFGHGVEMDMFVKHRARARNYVGKQVASPLVEMHDGAAAADSVASYFFDDDGVLAHDTLIIKDGILQTGISDVISAMQLGTEPTGNGRRESYKRKAYTRMTNTFFARGTSKLEDMIKSVKHGYMLFETNNGMEDPKNWNIQCTAEYGREIKDGKFTGKIVAPVVMSGYVPDLLMSISAVSDDFEVIGAGHCGKGHKEWVPVSDGGPCLKARCKLS